MKMSESDLDLPTTEELEKAAEAQDEKKEKNSSDSSESEMENTSKSVKKTGYSGILWEVRETKEELNYRSKHFKDPDDVITSRKLRCTACNTFLQSVLLEGRDIYQHPGLKVLLCKSCLEFYGSGDLSIDEDGSSKYCRWCAQGGTLYCCATCCNAFCKKCIKRNLNRTVLGDIESEEWNCFVCDGKPLWELRAICKNAYVVSKKIKRKRREEHERNLKQLQKKRKKKPIKNSRQLNRWQKGGARQSSSSSDEDNDEDENSNNKKSKKSFSKRKRDNTSTDSDGRKYEKKKKKDENLDSDVKVIESEEDCIVLDSDESKNMEDDKFPDQLDSQSAKEAGEIFTEHLTDLIQTGELIAYRAKRLIDKKVSEEEMSDPKKVEKVVTSINLLVKLSNQNMQHSLQFLKSQHVHWMKNVKKRTRNSRVKSKSSENAAKMVEEKQKEISEDIKIKDATMNGMVNGIESVEDKESIENGNAMEEDGNEADTCKKHKRKTREEDNDEVVEDNNSDIQSSEIEKQARKKAKTTCESDKVCENGKIEYEATNSEAEVKKTKDITSKDSQKDEDLEVSGINISEGQSDESITSMLTLKIEHNNSEVDMFQDSSFQENREENIPIEDDDKKQSVCKDSGTVEKSVEEADSGDDAATIELLCSEGSDRTGKSVAGDESSNHKKQDEVSVHEDKDPLALNESDLAVECNTKEKSRRNEDDSQTVSDLEKNIDKSDDNGGDLKLSDSVLEALTVGSKPEECEDGEGNENDFKEEKKKENYFDDCFSAQDALLGYTSDDEDDEECKKKRKKKDKTKRLKEVQEKKGNPDEENKDNPDTKIKQRRRIGPKSKTRQFRSSSSSSAADAESDSSDTTTIKRGEGTKKRKFRLQNTDAYKNDEKLGWTCKVDVKKLVDEQFQKYYENYYPSEEDEVAEDYREIERLTNLKSLKKLRGRKDEDSDESSDENEMSSKKRKQKREKKKEKDQVQSLIDIFNEEAGDSDAASDGASDQSGSENGIAKRLKKKSIVVVTNEMAMKMLLDSSCDDGSDDLNEDEGNEPKDKKKKQKLEEKVESENDQADAADVSEGDKMDVDEENIEGDKDEEKDNDDKADVNKEEEMEVDAKEEDSEGNGEKRKEEDNANNDEDNLKNKEDDRKKDEDDDKKDEEDDEKKDEDDKKKDKDDEKKKDEEDDEKKDEDDKKKDEDDEKKKDEEDDKKNESSDSDKSEKSKKKDWRKDTLLTERLTDLDTSDEERLWNKRRQREQKAEDLETDKKSQRKKKLSKEKVKRRILDSDDDEAFKIPSTSSESESTKNSSDDSDVFVIKKKKKKKVKKSDSDNSDSSSDFTTKKPKRRRIKAPASDSSSNEDEDGNNQKSGTPGKGRKKIHHIMSDDNVADATRKAAKEEEERRKRISDKQKLYNEIYNNEVKGVEKLDKLVLDFDPETKKELVSVDPNLVVKLKPHQAKGIKFMWDACFESIERIKNSKGTGCILAHCMGLGKTFQIVSLVHTLLNHKKTQVKTVLVICPLTTVLNWCSEFTKWLKDGEVNVFELTRYKLNYERQYKLKEWLESGGVMVLGYEMYRTLTNPQAKRIRKKDINTFQTTLVDPGPDLIVCDEGHVLKNEDSAIARALRRVTTLRRIVLTGTPLQNNLKEYHCMVQFVKPNLLGTRKEFLNRFVNPITNGQFEDSTLHDVKIMKRRAHVLHKMLEASVQRFDYSVLTPFLPPKQEYVISIRLHEVQVKAYRHYMDFYARRSESHKGAQLFSDFNNLQRIWTHPRVLQMSADREEKIAEKKQLLESDSEGSLKDFIDDDDDATSESSNKSSAESSKEDSDVQVVSNTANKSKKHTRSQGPVEEHKDVEIVEKEDKEKEASPPWWKQFMQADELENINYSGKLVILFSILRECEKIGDKVLVFSQSLLSLDLIEHFLAQIDLATQSGDSKEELGNHTGSWSLGLDYFRIDGSASSENRHIWCKSFNREDNHRARLFLISTRAGGLGINLYGANRVIIFDASWNPSHDVQSIFRVYRFGQKKPCYIYRFLAQGTMEEKIYDRQVTKLSLSCRVVDEQQIERHYNMADLQELYQFDPEQKTKRPTPILPKDRLLAELLKEEEQWIVTYHEHDSLLENKEEEELNEDERKAAWEEYENEKQGKVVMTNQPVGPNLNMQALREALKSENPQATNEELEQKVSTIMGQIYDYLRNQQNTSVQQKYTAAQIQALQQYQIQQQQMRAQREKQIQMQQDLSFRAATKPAAGFSQGTNLSFQQYIQNATGSNMYQNPYLDPSGLLRMQSKLVPFNPKTQGGSRVVVKNFGMQDMGPNHLTGRLPLLLPKTSMHQPPSSVPKAIVKEIKEKDTTKKSVPEDVIETID